jgi:hypothetical protein
LEKQRDKIFNSYRPMVPQGKEWRAKTSPLIEAVKPLEGAVELHEVVKPAEQAVGPGSLEMPPGFASPFLMACDDNLSYLL